MPNQSHTPRSKITSAINVTPMVDVMLVLLIIFMVITPMLRPHGTQIQMALASNAMDMPEASTPDALVVAVMRDGRIFLGSESVTAEWLPERLRERLSARSTQTVYVRADARARYKFVVDAVDDVRTAGVDQLGLLTEQKTRNLR